MEGAQVKYLLDTATWLNHAMLPGVIPPSIRRLIDEDEAKGLCSVSLLEAAILHRLGRLGLQGSLDEFFRQAITQDVELLELTPAVAAATNALPRDFLGDPFDRTIAATAKVLRLTLITPDKRIRDSGFCPTEYYPFKPSMP
jgi:PIN domain nuclease of toxin-antitoxin system